MDTNLWLTWNFHFQFPSWTFPFKWLVSHWSNMYSWHFTVHLYNYTGVQLCGWLGLHPHFLLCLQHLLSVLQLGVWPFLLDSCTKVGTQRYNGHRCNLLPLMLRNWSILLMSCRFACGLWENNGSGLACLFFMKNKGTFLSDISWSEPTWVSYSVFVETHGAHTLLGTVIRLYIPASLHFVLH